MNKLIIKSSNPDWTGSWEKDDIEEEMSDLLGDYSPTKYDWFEFLIDHIFDDNELNFKIAKFFKDNDEIKSMVLIIKGYRTELIKG